MKNKVKVYGLQSDRTMGDSTTVPQNLLQELRRVRSLNRGLEGLGYSYFLLKLYRKAMHSKSVMN